jgi:hypothetical protein
MKNYYMSDEDFNKFLQDIKGLENGFYSDRPKITERGFFSISSGWLGLVKELIEKAIEAGWDRQICQVKEKFGGLRFYINSAPEEVHNLIMEAEKKSYEICERCGDPGEPRRGGWITTLCDKHNEER